MDINMEDTIVVRPSGSLDRTSQENWGTKMVDMEHDRQTKHNSSEDRVVLREGFSVPQKIEKTNPHDRAIQNLIEISDEDFERLNEMGSLIEQLKEQTSFNINWRQEAESDYLATRQRLADFENSSSLAIKTASEAGHLSCSLRARVEELETALAEKNGEIRNLQNELQTAASVVREAEVALSQTNARLDSFEKGQIAIQELLANQNNHYAQQNNATWDDLERGTDKKMKVLSKRIDQMEISLDHGKKSFEMVLASMAEKISQLEKPQAVANNSLNNTQEQHEAGDSCQNIKVKQVDNVEHSKTGTGRALEETQTE